MSSVIADFLQVVAINHGPRELLWQFFTIAERRAREAGVTLRLRSDLSGLFEAQRANRESWPLISPTFDPQVNQLDASRAFWIQGIDSRGDTVIANATRFFDWTDTTLADELRSLRAFYGDPAPHIAAGEFADVPGDMAAAIRGRTSTSGALWVRPDHRRLGLAWIIGRLSRACACARWDVAYCWALTEQRLHDLGLTRAYGHSAREVQQGLVLNLGSRGRIASVLTCQDREALLADLAHIVREPTPTHMNVAHGGDRQHAELAETTAPGKEQPIVT
jgi:hypothetical protein